MALTYYAITAKLQAMTRMGEVVLFWHVAKLGETVGYDLPTPMGARSGSSSSRSA